MVHAKDNKSDIFELFSQFVHIENIPCATHFKVTWNEWGAEQNGTWYKKWWGYETGKQNKLVWEIMKARGHLCCGNDVVAGVWAGQSLFAVFYLEATTPSVHSLTHRWTPQIDIDSISFPKAFFWMSLVKEGALTIRLELFTPVLPFSDLSRPLQAPQSSHEQWRVKVN